MLTRKKVVAIAFVFVLFVITMFVLDYLLFIYQISMDRENNILIENNTIVLDSLTLRQKIAQMIVVRGDNTKNLKLNKFNIGGVFFDRQESEQDYTEIIERYREGSEINLFITTDLEGFYNPFSSFESFQSFSEIESKTKAYDLGLEQGRILKKIGFNLDFSPVAEFYDKSYGGRVFKGTEGEVKEKVEYYLRGLQKNVLGTCKHYPGRGMINNLHEESDEQVISEKDTGLFDVCIKNNISSIMVGHQIVSGELDSKGRPSTVSKEVISSLGNFSGLVIIDEVNMKGLKKFYFLNKRGMYRDIINAGGNVILDFSLTPKSTYQLLLDIENQVKRGEIDEKKIDESVTKILRVKGYRVI